MLEDIFWLSQLGSYCWHPGGRGQGCFSTSSNAQDSAHNKELLILQFY